MHIKLIELSGFKSYGCRTEVKGFDPLFNAITGLNGSGKSNILDSICFVLGITNLTQVRASNLQELVYKNGQAGITKAAVSITFDNSDSSASPLGYEQHKEITVTRMVVVGGRNKYLINGAVANNHRVQDFFQSVQLNVNNPHFLIMQGRITKVLNMKPMEILSMVEEAAGTRMYELKKDSSLKLMMKKEDRLREIDSVLIEDITPKLEKLKNERKDYIEFTKITRELDHMTKFVVAWEFVKAQELSCQSTEDAKKILLEIGVTQENMRAISQKVSEAERQITDLEKKKDDEAGGRLLHLENELKQKQMAETKVSNSLQNLKSSLKDSNKKMKELEKSHQEEISTFASREKDISNFGKKIEDSKVVCENDAKAVTAAEKHLHDVNAGLVKDSEGKAATIASQLMAAEEDIKRAETEEKMASMSLDNLKRDLAQKQAAYTDMDDSYRNNQTAYKSMEKETNNLKQEMTKLGYDEGKARKVKAEKEKLEKEVRQLTDDLDEVKSRFPQLEFDYVDPVKNFDRRKVHGLVCNLIKVKDPATATALELAAGSRLLNVVVEDDATGKLLLDKGQLKRRYTIIPLNKIIARPIEKNIADQAERLVGKQNVSTALSLIEYDKKVETAMQFVFGGVFVCSNMEAAKKVTFAESIKKKSVTLEGEVFDPAGTLSGGSMNQRSRLLAELTKIKEKEQLLYTKQRNLQNVLRESQAIGKAGERFHILQANYELKTSELSVVKAKIEQSNYHHQVQELEIIKQCIEEKNETISRCKELKKKSAERYKELKATDTKSARQQELKNAEKAMTDCQKKSASSEKEYKKAQQELEQCMLEAEDLKKSISNYEQQIEALIPVLKDQERKILEVEEELGAKKAEVSSVAEEVKSQKALLKGQCVEIAKLRKAKDAMLKEKENAKLHMQQLEHDVAKSKKDAEGAEGNVERYLETYLWIADERKYFGVPNTEFDFTNHDPNATSSRLNKLQDTKSKLSKTVNMRAQNMLTLAEEQYRDLVNKKKVVIHDKEQIETVIRELDEKKKISLRNACEKVNGDFGSIFSTLLPGAKAKLIPQEENNVLEGLEFKVGFGDVWKESLTELSGGQRSLVALSLILSLLLFKPAPIYILDEVDAALDLSHTQNIGQMLKKHFKKSQFIVVSLKDGMFNNANVLFKTKFVDGMSTIQRIAMH